MTQKAYHHGILVFCVLSFSVVAWIILLHYISPADLVETIGLRNGYLVMFLVSLLGGVSSFTGVSFVATVLTLSAGGLNPVFLALASGIGITISDSLFFWIGRHAQHVIEAPRLEHLLDKIHIWLNDRSKLVVGIFIYVYTGFTPLPTDLLTIILGLTRQSYVFVISVLILGNITFTYILATLGGTFFTL
jgi:membrane protein DedA with SNARE-associated domain